MCVDRFFGGSLIALVGPALLAATSPGHLFGADWQITQLIDNAYDDQNAKISGSNVVWEGWDGNDWEIFFLQRRGNPVGE